MTTTPVTRLLVVTVDQALEILTRAAAVSPMVQEMHEEGRLAWRAVLAARSDTDETLEVIDHLVHDHAQFYWCLAGILKATLEGHYPTARVRVIDEPDPQPPNPGAAPAPVVPFPAA